MPIISIQPQPEPNSYDVQTDFDLYTQLPAFLKKHNFGTSYAIITDTNIKKLYGTELCKLLNKQGLKTHLFTIPAGEHSKNFMQSAKLCSALSQKKCDRKTCILALGGGVVGDLAGFVARIFLRGIPFIQIPTSLLAMVDSAIGGKVGVDMPEGKNLMGAFYTPKAVLMDIRFLEKLPEKELRMGLAEVIKYGVILDRSFFEYLEKNVAAILSKKRSALEHIITVSAECKAHTVNNDEKEKGLRMILNYGHTLGHAIEHLSKFKLAHGEAISIGMHFANLLAEKLTSFTETKRINDLLQKYDLPVVLPKKFRFTPAALLKVMEHDKKNLNGNIQFILPKSIGTVITKTIDKKLLHQSLSSFLSIN